MLEIVLEDSESEDKDKKQWSEDQDVTRDESDREERRRKT